MQFTYCFQDWSMLRWEDLQIPWAWQRKSSSGQWVKGSWGTSMVQPCFLLSVVGVVGMSPHHSWR